MNVTIKVAEEIVARAKARGIPVEAYVEEILRAEIGNGDARTPHTPAEIRAWLDSLSQFSEKIPPLPDQITREWIYQEHD